MIRTTGVGLLVAICGALALGPAMLGSDPDRQYPDWTFAPPMPLRVVGTEGVRAPFYYPLRLVDRVEGRFDEDRTRPVPVFRARAKGAVDADDPGWMPLGGDALGRNVAARLLHGGRISLAVALGATLLALVIGVLVGSIAGGAGGVVDEVAMRVTEFVVVLPALYLVLALRSALPLVLSTPALFLVLVSVLGLAGWAGVARGIRTIVAREKGSEYAMSARAAGAGTVRLVVVHLLPAAAGWVLTQALLLLPAFVMAEATLSYVGLGFRPPTSSWGTMLQDAANVSAVADHPWVLSPAVVLVGVVLGANLAVERD